MPRVRLIDINKDVQAVCVKERSRTTKLDSDIVITIHGKHSNGEFVKFEAPFIFESRLVRNKVFQNDNKMVDFIVAVYNHQMALIDKLYKPIPPRSVEPDLKKLN